MPFTKMNLNYLQKDIYDAEFLRNVYQSAVVSYQELKDNKIAYDGPVRIPYHTKDTYRRTAKLLGLMDDFRVSKIIIKFFWILMKIVSERCSTNGLSWCCNVPSQRKDCVPSTKYELERLRSELELTYV